jgi:hypothetical protein
LRAGIARSSRVAAACIVLTSWPAARYNSELSRAKFRLW